MAPVRPVWCETGMDASSRRDEGGGKEEDVTPFCCSLVVEGPAPDAAVAPGSGE